MPFNRVRQALGGEAVNTDEYPADPRQQPKLDTEKMYRDFDPVYNEAFYKGFHSKEPQYWLTPEGQEEQKALLEPSIMDEYIQKNDPEQWGRIRAATLDKYAQDIGQMVGTTKLPGLMGTRAMPEVLPATKETIAKAKEVMPGFFSKATQLLEEKMGGSATPQQILGILREAKPQEVEYLKIPEFLEGKTKVSKPELLEYIQKNFPAISKMTRGGDADKALQEQYRKNEYAIDAITDRLDNKRYESDLYRELQEEAGDDFPFNSREDELALQSNEVYMGLSPEKKEIFHQKLAEYDKKHPNKPSLLEHIQNRNKEILELEKDLNEKWYKRDELEDVLNQKTDPKHIDYGLPGGKNYQEHLFQYADPQLTGGYRPVQNEKGGWDILDKESLDRLESAIKEKEQERDKLSEIIRNLDENHPNFENDIRQLSTQAVNIDNQLISLYAQIPYKSNYPTRTEAMLAITPYENKFSRSHFNEPNILGNTYTSDRIDPEGKKHLFIEELQSDWHQQGIDVGYKGGKASEQIKSEIEKKQAEIEKLNEVIKPLMFPESGYTNPWNNPEFVKLHNEADRLFREKSDLESALEEVEFIPDAPFKKNWHELLLKQMLREAALRDADYISWPAGKVLADRHKLSKVVDEIYLIPNESGGYNLLAKKWNRGYANTVLDEQLKSIKDAEKYIGKAATEKLNEQLQKGVEKPLISGPEMDIGGKFLKDLMDEKLVQEAKKLGKKFGVEPRKMSVSGQETPDTAMPLTKEFKEAILKGLPLFSAAGVMIAPPEAKAEKQGLSQEQLDDLLSGKFVETPLPPKKQNKIFNRTRSSVKE